MLLQPANLDDLVRELRTANATGTKVSGANLAAMNRLLEHVPEDMTCTVETGMNLQSLQSTLAARGQWLPVDPPQAERFTIGELIGMNLNGPRRFGYGTVRDYLIGMKVVLADGRLITSGGKVVKNVAGYDLCKLFIGSGTSLGILVEASFKLRPLPATTATVCLRFDNLDTAGRFIVTLMKSELTPTVMDLHNIGSQQTTFPYTLVIGFEGTAEEVNYQLATARELGIHEPDAPVQDAHFWEMPAPARISVLPSRLIEQLRLLGDVPFVARAGNGLIFHRGDSSHQQHDLPVDLFRRLKSAYDPKHTLPEL